MWRNLISWARSRNPTALTFRGTNEREGQPNRRRSDHIIVDVIVIDSELAKHLCGDQTVAVIYENIVRR